MTLAPRFLVQFWAGLRAARLARRLAKNTHDTHSQQDAFTRLVALSARTEFGRSHGLTASTTYAQFRERVPPRPVEWFEPLIARMVAGERNVLLPGRCPLFVETAGTTGGTPRLLPAPEAVLDHFARALRDTLFLNARRAGHPRAFLGRHLHLGASIAVAGEQDCYRTTFDGLLTLCLSDWAEANLRSPPGDVAALPEGPDKIVAAARVMLDRDVTLLGGAPGTLVALADAARAAATHNGNLPAQLTSAWPNLDCCLHTGAALGLFAGPLRTALGPGVRLHEAYAGAEGFFAAQDDASPAALRLLTDVGVFYEFLPLASYHESTLEKADPLCVPLAQVQPDTDYLPVLTTPAGLCRCITGDVVRFVSAQPPRLRVVGRIQHRLDTLGEHVTEHDVLETLQTVCTRNGWQPSACHVAPYEQRNGAGRSTSVHEWWLELHTHSVRTPMATILGPELDTELAQRHAGYAARRSRNLLGAPQVRLVMPGVFTRCLQTRPRLAAGKLPLCRPDRLIADPLAALAPFHQEVLSPAKAPDPAS